MLEAPKQMIVFFGEMVVFLKEMLFQRTNMLNCSLRLICLLKIWMCFQQKWSCWLGNANLFWQTWFCSQKMVRDIVVLFFHQTLTMDEGLLFFKWLIYFSIFAQPFFSWFSNLNGDIGKVACWKWSKIHFLPWMDCPINIKKGVSSKKTICRRRWLLEIKISLKPLAWR